MVKYPIVPVFSAKMAVYSEVRPHVKLVLASSLVISTTHCSLILYIAIYKYPYLIHPDQSTGTRVRKSVLKCVLVRNAA